MNDNRFLNEPGFKHFWSNKLTPIFDLFKNSIDSVKDTISNHSTSINSLETMTNSQTSTINANVDNIKSLTDIVTALNTNLNNTKNALEAKDRALEAVDSGLANNISSIDSKAQNALTKATANKTNINNLSKRITTNTNNITGLQNTVNGLKVGGFNNEFKVINVTAKRYNLHTNTFDTGLYYIYLSIPNCQNQFIYIRLPVNKTVPIKAGFYYINRPYSNTGNNYQIAYDMFINDKLCFSWRLIDTIYKDYATDNDINSLRGMYIAAATPVYLDSDCTIQINYAP